MNKEKIIESFPFLEIEFLGNALYDYAFSVVIFLGIIVLLKIFKSLILIKLKIWAKSTKNDFDDCIIGIIDNIKSIFYIVCALYFSFLFFLNIPDLYQKIFFGIFLIVAVYQVILILQRLIDYGVDKFINIKGSDMSEEEEEEERKNKQAVVKLISNLTKASLWVVGVILILGNLGVNVTSLVAGFGIGGIAVGLAVQSILSDVFSSLSIFTDKPFKVGDFITIGKESGTVKKIGIKTTRIQTLSGEELVVPNKDLTESRVHNYKKLEKRRASFKIGVTYETELKKLKKIPQIIKSIIKESDILEADRINFKEFGDFSLNFEAIYYIDSADYGTYVKEQEKINYKLMEMFEKENIEFAYPTQSIILQKK